MKNLIILSLTFLSLTTFADRNPASTQDPNDSTARSNSDPAKTGAGTNVIGLDCVACKAMETASKAKTLDDTSTIFRGGNLNSGTSGTTSNEPVSTGQ